MYLAPEQKTVLFPFAGMGGAIKGFERAGWHSKRGSAIEMKKDRCATLRTNFPELHVKEAKIEDCVLEDYGLSDLQYVLATVVTYPCENYTSGADIHRSRTGDHLYLEALRECVLLAPEVIVLENVLGMKKFARVMESWRRLRGYYVSECVVHGHYFSLMRKSRLFLILHRQPFAFRDLQSYKTTRPLPRLRDYLDEQLDPFVIEPRAYIQTRIEGGYGRNPAIFDPDRDEPIPLLYNYGNDRGNYLVRDKRVPGGVRPFSVAEVARLHTFDDTFTICGSTTSQYHQLLDCIMPAMAEAIGRALNAYFEAIPSLYMPPPLLGYREIVSIEMKEVQDNQDAPEDSLCG